MRLWQEGRAPEPPTEDVWFHEPNPDEGKVINGRRQGPFIPLDIYLMGASGVRNWLEKGDTWSGMGVFRSIEEAFRKASESNKTAKEKFRADQKDQAVSEASDKRRQYLKIPLVPGGIERSQTTE